LWKKWTKESWLKSPRHGKRTLAGVLAKNFKVEGEESELQNRLGRATYFGIPDSIDGASTWAGEKEIIFEKTMKPIKKPKTKNSKKEEQKEVSGIKGGGEAPSGLGRLFGLALPVTGEYSSSVGENWGCRRKRLTWVRGGGDRSDKEKQENSVTRGGMKLNRRKASTSSKLQSPIWGPGRGPVEKKFRAIRSQLKNAKRGREAKNAFGLFAGIG